MATKFDKVVNREVCRVTTKGTQTFSFLDGDATEAKSNYLLAVAEKVRIIYCESKYILQQREMILLLSFGHVSFNFMIPSHCHLQDFVSYVSCNDIIFSYQHKTFISPMSIYVHK